MRLNHLIFNDSNKILQSHGTKASAAAGVNLGSLHGFKDHAVRDQYTTSCQSLIQGIVEGKGKGPLPRDAGLRRQSCAGLWHRLAVSDCFQDICSSSLGVQKNSNSHEDHRQGC